MSELLVYKTLAHKSAADAPTTDIHDLAKQPTAEGVDVKEAAATNLSQEVRDLIDRAVNPPENQPLTDQPHYTPISEFRETGQPNLIQTPVGNQESEVVNEIVAEGEVYKSEARMQAMKEALRKNPKNVNQRRPETPAETAEWKRRTSEAKMDGYSQGITPISALITREHKRTPNAREDAAWDGEVQRVKEDIARSESLEKHIDDSISDDPNDLVEGLSKSYVQPSEKNEEDAMWNKEIRAAKAPKLIDQLQSEVKAAEKSHDTPWYGRLMERFKGLFVRQKIHVPGSNDVTVEDVIEVKNSEPELITQSVVKTSENNPGKVVSGEISDVKKRLPSSEALKNNQGLLLTHLEQNYPVGTDLKYYDLTQKREVQVSVVDYQKSDDLSKTPHQVQLYVQGGGVQTMNITGFFKLALEKKDATKSPASTTAQEAPQPSVNGPSGYDNKNQAA